MSVRTAWECALFAGKTLLCLRCGCIFAGGTESASPRMPCVKIRLPSPTGKQRKHAITTRVILTGHSSRLRRPVSIPQPTCSSRSRQGASDDLSKAEDLSQSLIAEMKKSGHQDGVRFFLPSMKSRLLDHAQILKALGKPTAATAKTEEASQLQVVPGTGRTSIPRRASRSRRPLS